ncbi:MAG TPA: multidrug effflux MFS transporter [Chryseolinea sp.]|nr:multidrug effflux MFS transporter [Chryseolinea sp.]HPH46295.1 multidrug effflux MFS transporter [Chryseolinea sp.]HPM30777.1 multidrug effflux MFS transporter [Chryseolinea sp.]
MSTKQRYYFFLILILGALATISPFSIDMYLPGFPAIATDLSTTIDKVQLSLTAYLVGIALGQILYGPLLDRFGRKNPLYAGLAIYVLASIGCAFTDSISSLIVMRFLQALGGCAGIVAAQALVRDLFPVNKTAQAFSSITLVISVSPMIAPTVGGYMTSAFGWQYVFLVLGVITFLIMGAVYFYLPDGRGANAEMSLKPKAVLSNFYVVIKEPQFFVYAFAGGLATAAPFAYIAGSADVFMNIYKLSEHQYGWVFAFLAFAMIGSTQLNRFLLKKFKSEQIIKTTLMYQSVIGLILVVGTYYGWYDKYALILLMFVFLTGQGLTGPNTSALSLAPFSSHAGSASALMGSWRLGAGGIISAIVSFLHNGTAMPMVSMMAACAVISLMLLYTGNNLVRYRARHVDDGAITS